MKRGCGCLISAVVILVSLGSLLAGLAWGLRSYAVSDTWTPAQGTVVELMPNSEGSTAPIVEFDTVEGVTRRFQHSVFSSGALSSELGDQVDVLYDPEAPDDAIIRSNAGLWLGPAIFTGVGMLGLLAWFVGMLIVRRGSNADRKPAVAPSHGPKRSAEFRRVETNIDDTGTFHYRIVAKAEDGVEYFGDWTDTDPTMDLITVGYQVALVQKGDRWVVVRI